MWDSILRVVTVHPLSLLAFLVTGHPLSLFTRIVTVHLPCRIVTVHPLSLFTPCHCSTLATVQPLSLFTFLVYPSLMDPPPGPVGGPQRCSGWQAAAAAAAAGQ